MNTKIQELEASIISLDERQTWKELSEEAINSGEVERISLLGLINAVEQLAYSIVTDAFEAISTFPKDTIDLSIFEPSNTMLAISKIHYIVALSSGIHPSVIGKLVDEQTDKYADEYINKYKMEC